MIHTDLAAGRWQSLTLAEQLGNIGSEISRAKRWQGKNEQRFNRAVERAIELLELTVCDDRWKSGRKELARVKELFIANSLGETQFNTTFDDLQTYCDSFAMMSRKLRS